MARNYAFFNFSKHYLAEHQTISKDFEVNDEVFNQFRQFLKEQQVPFQDSDLEANRQYIQQGIKMELVLSVFGMDEEYKLEAAADPQIQRSIELLPQAAALLENAKQLMAQKESR